MLLDAVFPNRNDRKQVTRNPMKFFLGYEAKEKRRRETFPYLVGGGVNERKAENWGEVGERQSNDGCPPKLAHKHEVVTASARGQ